jgi:hypothetical protein
MIKESNHQETLTILKVSAPNNRASKYMKQKLDTAEGWWHDLSGRAPT